MRLCFLIAAALLAAPVGRAADPEKIDNAVNRGAAFLRSSNLAVPDIHGFGIGPGCLAGLALLECGMKPEEPQLRAIQQVVRERAITEANTYQVSLAILFLDRLGDEADRGLIQILGARLLSGQTITGGWGYATFDFVTEPDQARVRSSLRTATERGRLNPEAARILALVARGQRSAGAAGGDDNSNTQFALLGAWVSRRHGIPADGAIYRLQQRFLRSQSPADGGWGYSLTQGSSPSMTCAGLLALAAGKAMGESELVAARPDGEPGKKPEDDDPFFRPPAPGGQPEGEEGDPNLPPPPPPDPISVQLRDKAIERALKSIGALLQQPGNVGGRSNFHGGMDDLYFFWSLERVAVAFDLDSIGGVDWYAWGCGPILEAQKSDGSWEGSYGTPIVGTAFALLFLKKANLTSDLTRKVAGKVNDPGGAELRGGRGSLPISTRGNVSSPRADEENPAEPGVNRVRQRAAAEAIAEALVNAPDREWNTLLRKHRDAPGPQHTWGIVQALAALEGRRHFEAREALAERLTRMNRDTLRHMLTERDAELRRAACLAVAMKDDRELIPDVIDCILDPNDIVVRAAKASLKAISGEDHGPAVGANDDEKRAAADAWRLWFALDQRRNK